MGYFSVIKDGEVVGVASKLNYITHTTNGTPIPSKPEIATAIVDDFERMFRLPWMKQNEYNKSIDVVILREIENIQEFIELSNKIYNQQEQKDI